MRFGDNFLEELKARVRPSDVVGRHVKLKRQGREFAGLSPFTNEKTPSFFVNDEKGFYHCFSSGKHGDAISLMERAQEFFEKTLYRGDGEAARDYLKGRGLSKTAARAFGMGFAPEWARAAGRLWRPGDGKGCQSQISEQSRNADFSEEQAAL